MSPNAYSLFPDKCYRLAKAREQVCIVCNHVAYAFLAPLTSWAWDEENTAICEELWIYCHQGREGVQTWYAFSDPQERLMFIDLIEFDGIGPGVALKILSKTHWKDISLIVESKDKAAFLKLPALSGKLGQVVAAAWFKDVEVKSKIMPNGDVVAALTSLGFKKADAVTKVLDAMAAKPGAAVEDLIKACLRK
jgi:Holliday junction resolvasome RuvABC DNA-binding subunit